MHARLGVAVAVAVLLAPAPALAQRARFERAYDVPPGATLDVSTIRGRIDVRVGPPGRIRVTGDTTVRVGFGVPANAWVLAQRVAADPPIALEGATLRLTPPPGSLEQSAMTIRYEITVPPDTVVRTRSDSGATTVRDVEGSTDVETGSGAIELAGLSGGLVVLTRSGSVRADEIAGGTRVRTDSGSIRLRGVRGDLDVRTESGSVEASLEHEGDVDVATGSSSIDLDGVRGQLSAATRSGHIRVQGEPIGPWTVRTDSSAIELTVPRRARFTLDARSETSDVHLEGMTVAGDTAKGLVKGTVAGGGPTVMASSRSGRIRIRAR